MSLGEELKNIDPEKITEILDRIYGELGHETSEAPDLSEADYRALESMASYGFRRSKQLQARLGGEFAGLPPIEAGEEEAALMDQFMRGAAIGVWAAAAALKEYAELEKFESEVQIDRKSQ